MLRRTLTPHLSVRRLSRFEHLRVSYANIVCFKLGHVSIRTQSMAVTEIGRRGGKKLWIQRNVQSDSGVALWYERSDRLPVLPKTPLTKFPCTQCRVALLPLAINAGNSLFVTPLLYTACDKPTAGMRGWGKTWLTGPISFLQLCSLVP